MRSPDGLATGCNNMMGHLALASRGVLHHGLNQDINTGPLAPHPLHTSSLRAVTPSVFHIVLKLSGGIRLNGKV